MKTISTYHEALKAIWDRSGYDRGFISNPFAGDDAARLGLTRTRLLLNQTGFAELPYAIVHVAGSKGKGSTCTMIDGVLRAANLHTGLYLSPHLHSFRERFVVDGELISEGDFTRLAATFISAAETIEKDHPELGLVTAFELTTAMALAWFAMQSCDTAVIEVGMGGALDSTNIITPSISVITTLDYEHTAILGSTMAEIAANKAGIIKQSRPVLTARQPAEAMAVIKEHAKNFDAPLHVANRDWHNEGDHTDFRFVSATHRIQELGSALVGPHQAENAGLAIAAVLELQSNNPALKIDEAAIRAGIASAQLPGRFEQVHLPSGQTIVIDGAHTPASMAALAAAVQARFPETHVAVIIGMLADKDPELVLAPLQLVATQWIVAPPKNPRAMSSDEMRDAIEHLGHRAETAASVEDGINFAKSSDADLIVVTGSFVTAAEARLELGLATQIDPPMS